MKQSIRLCILAFTFFLVFSSNSYAESVIRLLILKHSREFMAESDANLAINAVRRASSQGLKIKVIGNHYVDGRLVEIHYVSNPNSMKEIVDNSINDEAAKGDTLIVFTIGHGFEGGSLDNLGQRKYVMDILAQAAAKNRQKILWWQLSCHACAGLPPISSLPDEQQQYFSMIASSNANEVSHSGVQGIIMEKLFVALADKNTDLDPDGRGVTTRRLSSFLRSLGYGIGSRVFSKNEEFKVFGKRVAPQIPIIDINNKQGKYDEDYVLLPD